MRPGSQHSSNLHARGGFTLVEVLFAISLVAVVTAIVYESFAAVTDATMEARAASEELRIREFLTKNFYNAFSTVCVDPPYFNENYYFIATGGSGGGSSNESVDFASSAPLTGGIAPPGFCKRVHFGIASSGSSMTLGKGETADLPGLARSTLTFEATETLIPMTAAHPEESSFSQSIKKEKAEAAFGLDKDSPQWTAPIAGLDLSYFDGEKWVEEWDSSQELRMPWCVRIRLNFARTEQEADNSGDGSNVGEDPDFEMYIPIPIGMGVWTPADQWLETIGYGQYSNATQGGQIVPNNNPNGGGNSTDPNNRNGL